MKCIKCVCGAYWNHLKAEKKRIKRSEYSFGVLSHGLICLMLCNLWRWFSPVSLLIDRSIDVNMFGFYIVHNSFTEYFFMDTSFRRLFSIDLCFHSISCSFGLFYFSIRNDVHLYFFLFLLWRVTAVRVKLTI